MYINLSEWVIYFLGGISFRKNSLKEGWVALFLEGRMNENDDCLRYLKSDYVLRMIF
jgi:hypothetical protein